MGGGRYDIARFGAEVFRGSQRQSDLMIVAGRGRGRWRRRCAASTTRCPSRRVISMGACAGRSACSTTTPSSRVDQIVPVDVFVPMPAAARIAIYGIVQLQRKIAQQRAFA